MYESNTYDAILSRMLNRVPNTIDKREGSIIYDALAPAAVEIAQAYIELDVILNESFADTASREYLIKRAAERGLNPFESTNAVGRGEFNVDVPLGERFSLEDYNYIATEKISNGVYKLICETAGTTPNGNLGTLIPIDYIEGLNKAILTEILIHGEDEEETEDFRERYYSSLTTKSFGGNKSDYKEKVNVIPGVGGVKVYPVWNGGGTVKLVIIDSSYGKASSALIDFVQTEIDPTQDGNGIGIAPIGHVVTVDTVENVKVNIESIITYQDGYTFEDVKSYIESVIDDYFMEMKKTWQENDIVVRISQIESRMLNITGVLDVTGTIINGSATNLALASNSIPVRGNIVG